MTITNEERFRIIYGDMCAAFYTAYIELFGKEVSIKKINESNELKKWAKICSDKKL